MSNFRFLKHKEIYRGDTCVVYRGEDPDNSKQVIIKQLIDATPTPQVLARFRREFNVLNLLNFKSIIKVLDIYQGPDVRALILEDCNAISLRKVMDRFTGDVSKILDLSIKICEALSYIHNAGIIHRDIKPDNITVNLNSGLVQLIDFGLATELHQIENGPSIKKIEGTFKYISPEQTGRVNRGVDQRSDLYSLGIVLFELLTGQVPFNSNSSMELIHMHMAKQLPSLIGINPRIPLFIEKIVTKLLEKDPRYRYQTAYGLKYDLELALSYLAHGTWPSPINLGQRDFRTHFQISDKLYGRDKELHILANCLKEVTQNGVSHFACILGPSGSGKSALIKEFVRSVHQGHGLYAAGKCDQFQTNIPFVSFIECFSQILQEVIDGSEEQKEKWKAKIIKALGENTQLLVEVIPALASIIGQCPSPKSLLGQEGQNRFLDTFIKFINIFSSNQRPLVIFLDDIQWADIGTIALIKQITLNRDLRNILLICAYRDGQVDETHPLTMTLREIERQHGSFPKLKMNDLTVDDITQLIDDSLGRDDGKNTELASLVFEKTRGNSFFVNSFLKELYNRKLVRINFETAQWQWSIKDIKSLEITSNVVELMSQNLLQLEGGAKELIKVGACLGNSFSLHHAALVLDKSLVEVAYDLTPLVSNGFLLVSDEQVNFKELAEVGVGEIELKFLHDRIQQAAYGLIKEGSHELYHHKIATVIGSLWEKDYFSPAYHLNKSRRLIKSEEKELEAALINLKAGKKAFESSSFATAKQFYEMGLEFLKNHLWKKNYRILMDLRISYGEALALCSEFEASEKILIETLDFVNNVEDFVKIKVILLTQYTTIGRFDRAISSGAQALQKLDVYFPSNPKLLQAIPLLLSVKLRIALNGPDKILGREIATDKKALLAMEVLSYMSTAAYISGPEAMLFLCLRAVDLSLKFGNAPVSAFAYGLFAFIEAAKLGNIKNSEDFSQLAIDLNHKFKDPEYRCKVLLARGSFIQHCFEPIKNALPVLEESFQSGMRSGDFNFANYSLWSMAVKKYFMGKGLEEIYEETCNFSLITGKVDDRYTSPVLGVLRRHVAALSGLRQEHFASVDEYFDEEAFRKEQRRNGYSMGMAWFTVYDGMTHYYATNLLKASERFEEAGKYVENFLLGQVTAIDYYLFSSLCYLRIKKELPESFKSTWKSAIKFNISRLKYFASIQPENFLSRYKLLHAVWIWSLKGPIAQVEEYLELALESANLNVQQGMLALICEHFAEYYQEKGKKKIFKAYLKEASLHYENWGAVTKVISLRNAHPFLIESTRKRGPRSNQTSQTLNISQSISTSLLLPEDNLTQHIDIDLNTIFSFNRTLAEESDLHRLMGKFLHLFCQNSGADFASLALPLREGSAIDPNKAGFGKLSLIDGDKNLVSWKLMAHWDVNHGSQFPESDINENSTFFPLAVLKDLIARGIETTNLSSEDNDESTSSVAIFYYAFPILHQGEVVGAIYIQTKQASLFKVTSKIELMKLLASETGNVLTNAILMKELEQKVELRTQELNIKNQELEIANEDNKNLVRILCHDLNNTLSVFKMAVYMGEKNDPERFDFEKNKKLWSMIKNSTQTQEDIINHVKDMTALRTGKTQIQLSSVSLDEIFQRAQEIFENRIREKNLQVQYQGGNLRVLAEPVSLSNNVFNNIISNSIKFTPKGGTIAISACEDDDFIELIIQDSGIGIPDEILGHIFRPNKQTSRPGTDGEKGTGFGMPLVKTYIDYYGGKIIIESFSKEKYPDNPGTTIKIYLKKPVLVLETETSEIYDTR
jgi:predicted ATPase/signal transduction histidine kinase